MDHSENDKRFCVYVHKDSSGNVRYVGSGSGNRWKSKKFRSKEHLSAFDDLNKEIVEDGLSKQESILLEIDLYNKYSPLGLLYNRRTPCENHNSDYIYFSNNLYYDETSPTFLRWNTKCKKHDVGDVAGHVSKSGYVSLRLGTKTYLAHRIIWCICNKQNINKWSVIDHIDNNRSNNSINNLRAVTPSQNSSNRTNTVESSAIRWDTKDKSWILYCTVNGNLLNFSFSPHILFYNSSTVYEEAKDQSHNIACNVKKLFQESDGIITDEIREILDNIEYKRRNTPKIYDTEYKHSTECVNENKVRGICFEYKNENYSRWRVDWSISSNRYSRSFSIQKLFPSLPFEEAKQKTFELAVEFRNNKIKELANNAA